MKEFRSAVEAGDFAGLGELLADDVVFRSPVAFKPYAGKPIVAAMAAQFPQIQAEAGATA